MIGSTLGAYRVVSKLGEGGMGEVYLAEDLRLGRRVALKVLPPSLVADPDRVRRFEQEARAASALNHPNALTLFDVGQAGDRYYIATEYIDGQTLRAILQSRGRLPPDEAVAVARQCASALASAHAAGIVHRDIKPENVMIRSDGLVKVLDFGLAKMAEAPAADAETAELRVARTSAGLVVGTVGYLSPEQARGQSIDARTDIFSLGIVLFEMLTGRQPFQGPTASDTLASVLRSDPAPLSDHVALPSDGLQRIVSKALAKSAADRYGSMAELTADLDRVDGATTPVQPVQSSARLSSRAIGIVLAIGAVAVFVTVAFLTTRQTASLLPPEAARIKTLAVLPFGVLGYPAGQEHLGVGIADALIVKLTHLRQLTVRPTSAVIKYQEAPGNAGDAVRSLAVDAVLTGHLQRAGDRVRVTVQLVAATGGAMRSIWSDVLTTANDDPFAIQDQLTSRLVDRLALQLTGEERAQLTRPDTRNPRALHLYMEGRFFMNKGTPAGYSRALELFSAAVNADPAFAKAYLGQSLAWQTLSEGGSLPFSETVPKIRHALERAIELDPSLGEAYAARSVVARVLDWRLADADADSQRSMALDPNNPMVLQWRGVHLLALGRADEAVPLHHRAVEIDPLDMAVRSQLARALYLAKRYDEAIATAEALIQLDPAMSAPYQWLGQSQIELGRFDAAIPALERAAALAPGNVERLAALAHGYARAGRAADARALMPRLTPPHNAYHVATIHLGLGDREAALTWLARAVHERDAYFVNRARVDPKLDALRGEPRLHALLEQMR